MQIVTSPNTVLNQKTKRVKTFDSQLAKTVEQMIKIKNQKNALGLAANQVGIYSRIAVIGYKNEKDNKILIPEITLINPIISWRSDGLLTESEKCLSVNDKSYDVPRSKKIHIHYQDINGKKLKLKARGLLARVIQHEIDHLNGKKISDYK